jgi:regulatory protein
LPIITKIEHQKKRRNRFNLYIDKSYYCSLSEDTIMNFGLKEDEEITESKLEEIKNYDEYLYAKKISLDFLAYRIRSEKEIITKLKSKKISPEIIEKTINHLNKLGLINDYEFGLQLASEKIKNKFLSKRALMQKLAEKGISKKTSEEIISSLLNSEREMQLAKEVYKKLKPRLKGLDKIKKKKKIYETLMRKGFELEIIQNIINENITVNSN